MGIHFDEPAFGGGASVLPNGQSATLCTNCAEWIREHEPRTRILGWHAGVNPTVAAADSMGHPLPDLRLATDFTRPARPVAVGVTGYRVPRVRLLDLPDITVARRARRARWMAGW
jgi:hypothetical protein